jgi:hypothetical protein
MDVSRATATQESLQQTELHLSAYCHTCGYPRIGLSDGARCPECGDPPMPAIDPLVASRGAAHNRVDQAWLACVAGGLVLLVISSLAALKVALIMNLGGLVLAAVNAPAPKLWAAAMLWRSVGSPGEWGVLGTIAVLTNVLAIWLITEPRFVRGAGIGTDELVRRLARWSSVLGCGGLAGLLWGGYEISIYWGWDALNALVIAVGAVELPANALLYWHLSKIAQRFDAHRRAELIRMLATSAVLICIVCGGGVVISMLRGAMKDQPLVAWRLVQSAYGALSLCCGMLMTIGVLRLLANVLAAASDRSVASMAGKLARLRGTLGQLVSNIRADPARWAAVFGLVWWLWNTSPVLSLTALIDHRRGIGGNLPAFNFIGPKVGAVAVFGSDSYYGVDDRAAIVTTVLAIWLITALRPADLRAWSWAMARWTPTLLVGFALGLAITVQRADYEVRQSYWAAGVMLLVEAPATFIVYRYLAHLAHAMDPGTPLARQLRCVSLAAIAIILCPLAFFLISSPLRHYRDHPLMVIAGAGYAMVAVAAGIAAWALVARLTWALVNCTRAGHTQCSSIPTPDTVARSLK